MFISICLSRRWPTSNNEWFASSSFVDFKIVVTIFAVYFCNFCLISFPLFTSLINFTCVDECVFRYIFCTNIRCSKVINLRWIKGVEFRYSWTFRINDFRNTFHIVVVCSTLKFDQFLTDNTLTKDTWCFLSWVSCCCYMFVTRDIAVVWSCKLLTCNTFLRIACQICFTSSRFVKLTWSRVTLDKLIVSCLLSNCIRNRSLNVWLVFIFVTWVVGVANLKSFILKVSVDQWEGHVTWISSVSTCVSQSIGYIRVIVCDVAWKRDIAFSSTNGTCISFSTIRLLHNTQMYIWVSWKVTSDGWTVYWKSSVVIKISLIARSMICLKELPYTKGITICVWIQGVTSLVESSIFNRCTIRICNGWNCSSISACWDWSQLCIDCWGTIYSSVTSKACCSQGCHHVIYWLAQTFALISVCLRWCIRIDQAVACCQFSLNFSDGRIKCCFLLWCWNSCWIVSCNLVQQCCFWSVLFQNNFIFSFCNSFSCFCSCFRSSCYSRFAKSCRKFSWTLCAQWSRYWCRNRGTCRSWKTCWFCCWFSSWFTLRLYFFFWYRYWIRCRYRTKNQAICFSKSLIIQFWCSRNIITCFVSMSCVRNRCSPEDSPCRYNPF